MATQDIKHDRVLHAGLAAYSAMAESAPRSIRYVLFERARLLLMGAELQQ
jgi:hypothetical protein